ncbi:MAG: hypothetical protein LQ341_002506 [Variospora aurantia]|nr:MAG: hypothetical protein LQ341_002506 [Variospora aurantia]
MADPFSIVASTAGILDLSWRIGSYLGKVKSAASEIERDLAGPLSFEVNALVGVTESIQSLWNDSKEKPLDKLSPDVKRIGGLWQDINLVLRGCRDVMGRLALLVEDVIGKDGIRVQGKLDGIRKLLRKQSNDAGDSRVSPADYEPSKQPSTHPECSQSVRYQYPPNRSSEFLTLISCYVRSSRDANDQSADLLSEKVEYWGFQLNQELAAIRTQVNADGGNKASIPMQCSRHFADRGFAKDILVPTSSGSLDNRLSSGLLNSFWKVTSPQPHKYVR